MARRMATRKSQKLQYPQMGFEPDIWTAIARYLVRPLASPFAPQEYKLGQGDLLNLVKVSKAVFNATAPIMYDQVAAHNPHSLVLGSNSFEGTEHERFTVKGTIAKHRLLQRVKALRLECGDISAVATYAQLASHFNNPGTAKATSIAEYGPAWEMVGEETHVERYLSYTFKLSDPKWMRYADTRAPLRRARSQLASWTFFWRWLDAHGGLGEVFPHLQKASLGDDAPFDPRTRRDLRWERLRANSAISGQMALASSALSSALERSTVKALCIGSSTDPSPMSVHSAGRTDFDGHLGTVLHVPRTADFKQAKLIVHVQVPPRLPGEPGGGQPNMAPPVLLDGKTVWDLTTIECDDFDWVRMAVTFVTKAVRNALIARKASAPKSAKALLPIDVQVYLPRVHMQENPDPFGVAHRRGKPGWTNTDETFYTFGMSAMMGLGSMAPFGPSDLFGEALGELSRTLKQVYREQGATAMKKYDKVDLHMSGSYKGCGCCGFNPNGSDGAHIAGREEDEVVQGDIMGMMRKMQHWKW